MELAVKAWKIAVLSSIGSGLEYYDFVIYIMLAPYLSENFFSGTDKSLDLIFTLGIFATAYLVRPLGGMIFGHFADRYGRKKAFLNAILIMAGSTLCMGLLPTYKALGIFSPMLLVLLRLMQGISQGAEIPGAMTFVAEHTHAQRRGLSMGILICGIGVGSALGSLVNFILTSHLTHLQMITIGWRIPFLLGGLLAIVGYLLRKKVYETALFLAQPPAAHFPILELLQKHKLALLKSLIIILFPACLIMFGLFFPAYLSTYFSYHFSDIYFAMTVSLLWSSFMLLVFGFISDYVGRKFLMLAAMIIAMLFLHSLFKLLFFKSAHSLLWFMLLYQTLIASLVASYPSMLTEIFVTKIRYSGVAITYNFSYTLAAFFPMLSSVLVGRENHPMLVPMLLSGLAALSFFVLIFASDATGKSLI
jgi:MFS family permease